MKNRPFLLPSVLFALPLMTGCQTTPPIRTITEGDNGSTVTLSHHDLLEVDLPATPSTGYTWQTGNINSWVLAPLKRPRFASAAAETNGQSMVGAGGTVTLTYQAVGTGTSPLELAYSRPWATNSAPEKSFSVTVIVK